MILQVSLTAGRVAHVRDLAEASRLVCRDIARHALGSTEWYLEHGDLLGARVVRIEGRASTEVARVSYNGRVWEPDGVTEIRI